MKIDNVSVFAGDNTAKVQESADHRVKAKDRARKNDNSNTIDGSGIASNLDLIASKREAAKKRALKIVGDAYKNEFKIDEDLNARRERIRDLHKTMGEASEELQKIEAEREGLRRGYGVDEDSKEQEDLKLLEKEVKSRQPGSDVTLTQEEREAIAQIKAKGLTEYQERSINLLESEWSAHNAIHEATSEIKLENQIISATENERAKSHAVLDAKKQGESIMDSTSKEIRSIIINDAKDHLEEESEKTKKKAEAEREKEEELEERIDAAKERRHEREDLAEDIIEKAQYKEIKTADVSAAQQEVKEMMSRMKLIEDDIKGAAIDQTL